MTAEIQPQQQQEQQRPGPRRKARRLWKVEIAGFRRMQIGAHFRKWNGPTCLRVINTSSHFPGPSPSMDGWVDGGDMTWHDKTEGLLASFSGMPMDGWMDGANSGFYGGIDWSASDQSNSICNLNLNPIFNFLRTKHSLTRVCCVLHYSFWPGPVPM